MVISLHNLSSTSKPYFDITVCGTNATVLLDSGANRVVFFRDKKWFDYAFRKAVSVIYVGQVAVKGLGAGASSGDEYLIPVFTLKSGDELVTIYNTRVVLNNVEHPHSSMLLGMSLFSNANIHINRDCDTPYISLSWRNSGMTHLMRDDIDVSDCYYDDYNWKSPYNLARILMGYQSNEEILLMFAKKGIDAHYFERFYAILADKERWHFDGFSVLALALASGHIKSYDDDKCIRHIEMFYDSLPSSTISQYNDMCDAYIAFHCADR